VPIADLEGSGFNLDLRNPHRPDDLAHRPSEELLDELIKTEYEILEVFKSLKPALGNIIKGELGWKRVRLGSIMYQTYDSVSVAADRTYPNFGIYSFGRGLFVKPDIEGATTSARVLNRVKAGQFIYSRLFAFEGAYGFVSPEFDKYFVSNEFPTFDLDPELLDVRWLTIYLQSPDRWIELASSSKGLGVRRQRVPVEAMLKYEVWLPPIERQRIMVDAFDHLTSVRGMRAQSNQWINALVPAALNEVFSRIA
jgi:type I restriction enzyme S subunit